MKNHLKEIMDIINSGNRGNDDSLIVDQIEKYINEQTKEAEQRKNNILNQPLYKVITNKSIYYFSSKKELDNFATKKVASDSFGNSVNLDINNPNYEFIKDVDIVTKEEREELAVDNHINDLEEDNDVER